MKNLKNYLIAGMVGLGSLGFFGKKSYCQTIEKTEDGFKQYDDQNRLTMMLTKINNQFWFLKFKYEKNGNIRQDMYIDYNKDGKIDLKKEYYTYSIQLKKAYNVL